MSESAMPFALRVWLLATRALAWPIRGFARRAHRRMGAAPVRFVERLGQPSQSANSPVIWFHAASLGEVSQIAPLVDRFRQSGRTILVTTTTQAGAEWVARELPEVVHQFAPMDTPRAVRGFLDSWKIEAAIFIEGDFGPRLILESRKRGVPHILLNARHSRTRERFSQMFVTLLADFALVTCRSTQVADGIRALGVPGERVHVLPDLRIGTARLPCPPERLETLSSQIGMRAVWLAASTHPADEGAVFTAHKSVLATTPDTLLIHAPRHPRRGDAIETAARDLGFRVARRSKGEPLTADTQIYLADTLGELGIFFTLAPIAFLGGAFGNEGGHNPYEPASFGAAILSGSKVRNFADAYAGLSEIGAAILLETPADLGPRLIAIAGTEDAVKMSNAAKSFMQASENSLFETVSLIETVIERWN